MVANQLNRVLEQQVVMKPIGWTHRTVDPFTVLGGAGAQMRRIVMPEMDIYKCEPDANMCFSLYYRVLPSNAR